MNKVVPQVPVSYQIATQMAAYTEFKGYEYNEISVHTNYKEAVAKARDKHGAFEYDETPEFA